MAPGFFPFGFRLVSAVVTACLLGSVVHADAFSATPPAQLELGSYTSWLAGIGSNQSPFLGYTFDWCYEERGRELPGEVYKDPEGIYVSVDRALSETIELEDLGEIPKAVTYGYEAYDRIDAPIETVLAAILFRWGKPIGQREGATFPIDTVYGQRKETIQERWGAGGYWNMELKTRGGMAKDVRDNYSLLVRGSSASGYEIIGAFHSPFGDTTTSSSVLMIQIHSMPGNFTAYRAFARHMGQYYGVFGVDYGRKNFGFNPSRVRDGQVEFIRSVIELKRTGIIRERPSILGVSELAL